MSAESETGVAIFTSFQDKSMATESRLDASDPRINEKKIPKIVSYRRANHSDIPHIWQMMGANTFELFGDVEVGQVFERACLSLVEINEEQEIVSSISLCNFPNVPSVPASDWLAWITRLYGVPEVAERDTLFVHLLVWDSRYDEDFLKIILNDTFAASFYCVHVIMIVPPGRRSETAAIFDRDMTRFFPINATNEDMLQTLYVHLRHQENPKLKIRRLVEEDNDDLIPIIDAESKLPREMYGDYYISEMMRHLEDENRQLIVAEDEGRATGVMCLNREFDTDLLIDNFELAPYNDLRKFVTNESPIADSISSSTLISSSSSEVNKTASEVVDIGRAKNRDRVRFSLAIAQTLRFEEETEGEIDPEGTAQPIIESIDQFSERRGSGIDRSMNFESVLRTSVFAEAIHDLPLRSLGSTAYNDESRDDIPLTRFSETTKRHSVPTLRDGESNAFILELFSMKKNIGEQHCQDYLEAAFECFPDLDYCAMLLPSTQPFFRLLEHFAQVPLRFDRDFPMVLYVAHRATILGAFRARHAISYDRESIENFLQGISKRKTVLEDFDDAMMHPDGEKSCYVFLCEDQIVGLAIICPELDLTKLCVTYDVENYVSIKNTLRDAHAQIIHFITAPMFSVHHRLFFCELMRLSFTNVLYYRLYDNETTAASRTRPLATCLEAMIPVTCRTRFHHPYPRIDNESDEKDVEKFSLFLTTPRFAMMPKAVVNAKIVIVGASDCGVACAEYLALRGSNLDFVHFTNLTVVSPNGMPFEDKGNTEHASMIPFKGRYCYEYRKFAPYRVWINVVDGIVSHINRKEKHLVVSGLGSLSYDYLVLTCGLQYQIPKFEGNAEMEKNGEEAVPLNCFLINGDADAATCLEGLRELTNDFTTKTFIVIYGRSIDGHCTLSTLLECGVKGSWIIMIEPKLDECEKPSDIFFEDDEVTESVTKSIRTFGVKIISGWNLKDWVLEISEGLLDDENRRTSVIKSLRIETKTQKKIIACDALIYFGDKTIPRKTFMATSRAGLVFDGHMVIDPDYRTNDPYIFAAGSFTQYSRKYSAEDQQHQYYNSIEVGERLAKELKQKIKRRLPNNRAANNPEIGRSDGQRSTKLPVFQAPIIVYCRLPGGLHYLHVRKPGKKTELVIDPARGANGEVFITGSASLTSDIGYFRIRLDQFGKIDTITCLRKEDFKAQDLITLYGKHESMLNNLKLRFQNSLIVDLFAYFTGAWAAALYHDKFDRLRVENRSVLLSEAGMRGSSLIEDALSACRKSNWKEYKEEYRERIESKYWGSVYEGAISSNLIHFLQSEEESLPMYCNPRKLRRQLQDD